MKIAIIKTNDVFHAKTHVEFLNKYFGTNYKQWMKCCYNINSTYEVWMIRFNKFKDNWTNTYQGNIIKDENLNPNRVFWDNKPLPKTLYHKKLVFEIIDNNGSREYVFKGVYEYQQNESDPYKIRIYKKIADYFNIQAFNTR